MARKTRALRGKYKQTSIQDRMEAFFLDNVGRVVTREQILEVAANPTTGKVPENWHQRLSELRTDFGYTIQSSRDTKELKRSEYRLVSAKKRTVAGKRVKISPATWKAVLDRAGDCCEWEDGGARCGLKAGAIDPIGGGTVQLTADHKTPHAMDPDTDADNPDAWQALCARHQVVKKNVWDHGTGKLNAYAIVQAAGEKTKRDIYKFLKAYFGKA